MAENVLYYGDNLDVLRRHVATESVDLVYLDPPFNSNATYNVHFAEQNGSRAAAQIKAFGDTWQWDQTAAEGYQEVVEAAGKPSQAMQAFRQFLGDSNMLAYLAMMAPRLKELRRVLKLTGSIYLHCDPTASHYLKMLMDAVFGPENFRNEIVWQRVNAHNMRTKGYARTNDSLLFFSKSRDFLFYEQYTAYGPEQMRRFKADEDGRLYKAENLTFSTANPSRQFDWRGSKPPANRSWGASLEQLEKWYGEGRILLKQDGTPRLDGLKIYLDETTGKPLTTNWADIPRISNTSGERLGYPTQKPEALLERIIKASSNEGDLVLDPFCGCGTTIAVAQRLNRRWIGIDITQAGIVVIKKRLRDAFGDAAQYQVIGEPTSVPDAQALADADPYQFQWWALGLDKRLDARPTEGKKGADKGIDGRAYFHDEGEGGKTKQVIFSVKAGDLTVAHVRDLRGVLDREKAQIGVLISMQEPTRPMKAEAAGAGFYDSPWGTKHPRLQLRTVGGLLAGKGVDMPPSRDLRTFKKAPKPTPEKVETPPLAFEK
jgi:DNA modification methylase